MNDEQLRHHREDHYLALMLNGDETLTLAEQLAACRSAYRLGIERGYKGGFERSFDVRHKPITGPSFAELCRRRGEEPDGKGGFRAAQGAA